MSGKTICKEQCTKCRCIVKERVLNEKKNDCDDQKDSCGGKQDSCEDKGCVEVYRDLGECLKKAIVSAAKKEESNC